MNELDRRKNGYLYHPYKTGDNSFARAIRLCACLSDISLPEEDKNDLLQQLLGHFGCDSHIVLPFRCDLGPNIHIGNDTFINMECLMLDEGRITIGDRVFIGPRLSVYTPIHPFVSDIRAAGLETCAPVTIENDVWIGGNVTIGPGVTIGTGSIIGMGSVVTRSIPAHVLAAGNPCKVIRPIDEKDRKKWTALYEDYASDPDIAHVVK